MTNYTPRANYYFKAAIKDMPDEYNTIKQVVDYVRKALKDAVVDACWFEDEEEQKRMEKEAEAKKKVENSLN